MKANKQSADRLRSAIESLQDGRFVSYPFGSLVIRQKSGRFYVDTFLSASKPNLDKMARIHQRLGTWGGTIPIFLSITTAGGENKGLVAILLSVFFLFLAMMMPSFLQIRILPRFFASVRYHAQDVDPNEALGSLGVVRRPKVHPLVRLVPSVLVVLILYWVWWVFENHIGVGFWWNFLLSSTSFLVLGLAGLLTALFLLFKRPVSPPWNLSKIFALLSAALTTIWMFVLTSAGVPWVYRVKTPPPPKVERSGVDWRVEIKQTDEPSTWPFDSRVTCWAVRV